MKNIKYKPMDINAFLILLFLFMGPITLPIKGILGNGLIVWIMTLAILIVSIWCNKKIDLKFASIVLIMLILISINIISVSYKGIVIEQVIDFIKFGIIPLYLTSNEFSYDKFYKYLRCFSYISIIILILYIPQVINGNLEYMQYGVYISYCFIAFLFNYSIYSKKNIMDLLMAGISLIIILFFGNRGSLIGCLIMIVFNILYTKELTLKKIVSRVIIIVILFITFMNSYNILVGVKRILVNHNISSYSINKYIMAFEEGIMKSSSGRDEIYQSSIELIKNSGFRANGIGYYTYKTGENYPHNFILDIMIIFGAIGTLIVLTILLILIIKLINIKDEKIKMFLLLILIYTFVRLTFSATFITEETLWLLIGLIINISERRKYSIKV